MFPHLKDSLPAGEVFGNLGPSGAGKTTTLRAVLGLVRPTAGLDPLVQQAFREAVAWNTLAVLRGVALAGLSVAFARFLRRDIP